jgi:serine/threonine-protein kinase
VYCPVCRSEYPADWRRCPKDEAALLRENKVGKYRIDQVIGQGGMGAVYGAFNPDTKSAVAIKLMHAQAAANDAARQRFQREAAAVAALRTRHVVTIFDFGAEMDGTLYLVMELLHGHTLRSELRTPIAPERLHMIVDGALRGLGAAHRAGITHRDLKPENIFIADTDDGEVTKILDFGIARTSSKDAQLTQSGALMGTPAYMAPEQVAGNRGSVGPWTDVYSMGVILYEALTGVSPFGADTVTEVLGKVLGRQFTPIEQLRNDLPPAVRMVVEIAMADPPDQRFQTADALRDAWIKAMGGQAATTTERRLTAVPVPTPSPTVSTAPTMTPGPVVVDATIAPPRRRTWPWLVALLAVGGAATAAILLATGGSKKPVHTPAGSIDARAAVAAATDAAPIAGADAAPPPDAAKLAVIDAARSPTDDMVAFAGGTFQLGADPKKTPAHPDLDPPHTVTVAAFWLDKREVTLGQLRAALGDDKIGGLDGDQLDWPARNVTAAQAAAACKAMGKRLPTEAEWEVAAQNASGAASGARLRGGPNAPDAVGTHPGDCTDKGVCDLLGNVMEWTADPWTRPTKKADRVVVRGGSYGVDPTDTFYATLHARIAVKPSERDPELGFRCAMTTTGHKE